MANSATIVTAAWAGDTETTLVFPDSWDVVTCGPVDAPKATRAEIETAFNNPIGSQTISDLARGRESAAIIVDDLSRPTPASEILPFVLNQLSDAGMLSDNIRIVVGGGSHRPITKEEIAQKVGPVIASSYSVSNHDFLSGDLRGLGSLPSGLPIYLNAVVADSDLKLCVGGIYPHGSAGFGGGAKLIVPGIAGFATMFYFHTFYPGRGRGIIERRGDEPDLRDASEGVARVLGLDAVVNVVLNGRREISRVFVGDFIEAQRAGAQHARQSYATSVPAELRTDADVFIANCFPHDYDPVQAGKSLWPLHIFENAYKVAINPATDGICYHGLSNLLDYPRFLRQAAEREESELPEPKIESRDQIIMCSQNFPVRAFYEGNPKGVLFRSWDTLLHLLREKLGQEATVAVFPCAAIQIPE